MSFLQLVQISKRYLTNGSSILALQDLSLSVARGEFVVLLGPSGCGKTTLLQIVAGLEPASSGQVLLEGRPVSLRFNRGGVERTLIFQQPNLFPWLTAEENVAFGLRLAGIGGAERRRAVYQALGRVGLAPEGGNRGLASESGNRGLAEVGRLYPHELSGGMQQRVALARALVLDPQVLLMDEPLAAVDALLRSRLQREIRAACAGKTVLFATHSIREALILADRVVILSPQPGQVRREITLTGAAPRPPTLELARLEEEIEGELVAADSA